MKWSKKAQEYRFAKELYAPHAPHNTDVGQLLRHCIKGFIERFSDPLAMATDAVHGFANMLVLCEGMMEANLSARGVMGMAILHPEHPLNYLLDPTALENFAVTSAHLLALPAEQKSHAIGTLIADLIFFSLITRGANACVGVTRYITKLHNQGIFRRAAATNLAETVAADMQRIMTVAQETAEVAQGVQEASKTIQNTTKGVQLLTEIEGLILKNKPMLELLDYHISELAKIAKPGKVGKILEKAHVTKIPALELETKRFYEFMRRSCLDVEKICQNTGIDRNIITRIKNHLFNEEHILRNGIGKFHPDEDIAAAWQRVVDNAYVYSDLKLLQHEYAEALIMNGLERAYDDVHPIIEAMYSWEKSL